jgi:hypothetical protein
VTVRFDSPKEEIGMRSFVTTFALALALAPAAAFAQTTPPPTQPPAQPPAGQQPPAAAQPAAPAAPAAPKLSFKTPAGMLFVQVKPDQTAVFEEMMNKIKGGLAASANADLKTQSASWKFYKAAEPGAGGNVMYIVLIEPAVANTEYQFFEVIQKTLSDEQKRDPATAEMYKKYNASIASMNMMNLTPGGGGL